MPRKKSSYPTRILINGRSGSGKSTLVENIAKALHYKHLDGGIMSRRVAREKGMTIDVFGRYRITHPKTDLMIDRRLIREVKKSPRIVVQSRYLPYAPELKKLEIVRIYLKADQSERIRRVAHRDNIPVAVARKRVLAVEKADLERFKKIYGLDIHNKSVYDLVVDTTRRSPTQTVAFVLSELKKFTANHG